MDFDADLTSLEEGVWREFRDSEFKIAHISNMKFQRALSRLQQPHRRKIENGTIDPKVNRDIVCQAMAEGVLVDWRKMKSGDGEKKYTSKDAFSILSRDPDLRDFVSDVAGNMSNYRDEVVKELGEDLSAG